MTKNVAGVREGAQKKTGEEDRAMKFRELNLREQEATWSLYHKSRILLNGDIHLARAIDPRVTLYDKAFLVAYSAQPGGFTACSVLVYDEMGQIHLYHGASRKNDNDKPNRIRGEMEAFVRALTHCVPVLVARMQ